MPTPPVSPLPRLDIPAKKGPWKWWKRMQSSRTRRQQFQSLMMSSLAPARLPKMRTLVDLGLWGDHVFLGDMEKDLGIFGFHVYVGRNNRCCPVEVLHMALEAGVDPNWREGNNYDDTLLTMFARQARPLHVQCLLEAGADPMLRDTCYDTALHLALKHMKSSGDVAHGRAMADALFAHGVDINSTGVARRPRDEERYKYPLLTCVEEGNLLATQWLLDRGADISVKDQWGNGVLHEAQVPLHPQNTMVLLDFLLDQGAAIDAVNDLGETAFYRALEYRFLSKALYLAQKGAALDISPTAYRDKEGKKVVGPCGNALTALVENNGPNPTAVEILHLIESQHPQCWDWPSTIPGATVAQWAEQLHGDWAPYAQHSLLTIHTPSASHPVSRPRF